jgi:hypothetical protein
MGDEMLLEGGCLCGEVRYRATGTPYDVTHCHCTQCRGASGAAFVTWFSIPSRGFALVHGVPAWFSSSPQAVRTFCTRCGTPLTFQLHASPEEIDVTVCSLDDPDRIVPQDHTFVRSRLQCIALADGLPQYAAKRE